MDKLKRTVLFLFLGILVLADTSMSIFAAGSRAADVIWGDIRTYSQEDMPYLSDAITAGNISYSTAYQRGRSSSDTVKTSVYQSQRFSSEYSSGYFAPQAGREMAGLSSTAASTGKVSLGYSWTYNGEASYWYSNTVCWNFTNTAYNSNIFVYYKQGAFYKGEYYDVKVYYWMEKTSGLDTSYKVYSSGSVQVVVDANGDTARQACSQVHMKMYFFKSDDTNVTFTDSTDKSNNGEGYKLATYSTVPANSKAAEFKGVLCITDMDAGEGMYFKSGVASAANVYLSSNTFIRRVHSDSDMHGAFNEYYNTGYTSELDTGSLYGVVASENASSNLSTLLKEYIADGMNASTKKFPLGTSTVASTLQSGYDTGLMYVSAFSNVSPDSSNSLLGNEPEYMSMWAEFFSSYSTPTELVYFTPSSRGADIGYRGVNINYQSVVVDNDCLQTTAKKSKELAADHATAYGSYPVTNASSAYAQAQSVYGSNYTVEGIYADSTLKTKYTSEDIIKLTDEDITLYVKIIPTYTVTAKSSTGGVTVTPSSTTLAEGDSCKISWTAQTGYVIADITVTAQQTTAAYGLVSLGGESHGVTSTYTMPSSNTVTGGYVTITEKDQAATGSTHNTHRNYVVNVRAVPITTDTVESSYQYEVPVTFNLTKTDSGDSTVLLQGATYSLSPYKALSGSTSYSAVTSANSTATTSSTGKISKKFTVASGTSSTYSTSIKYIQSSDILSSYSSTAQKNLFETAYKSTYTESTVRANAESTNVTSFTNWLTSSKLVGSKIQVKYTETTAPTGYQLSSTTKTSSSATVGSFSAGTDGVYRPTTALTITATDTNTPYSGTRQEANYSCNYLVYVPITVTLTKKDAGTSDLLSGAKFSMSSAITTNSSGVTLSLTNNTATATTNTNGTLTFTFQVKGSFTKNLTYYYYDMDSLTGSAKTAAQADVNANSNVYATKDEATKAVQAAVLAEANATATKLSNVVITVSAKETTAPTGYDLPSSATTTKTVTLGTLPYDSSTTSYGTTVTSSMTVTDTATAGTTATASKTQTYTYEIPTSLVITKTDATSNSALSGAVFSVTSTATDSTKTLTSETTNTQSVTTNSSGKATYSNTLTGSFTLTTKNYTYYTNYSSLKGSALKDANNAINNTTVFKTKSEAEAAADSELATLLSSKQTDLKNIAVTFSAKETTAPSGYALDTTTHTSSSIKSSAFTTSGTKLTGSISTTMSVTDTPSGGSLSVLTAQTKQYNYTIPVSIKLTKKDSTTNDALANATFTVVSKFGSESYGNSVSKTTDENGLLTATRNITGTISVTTSAYLYYTDYSSLVSSAKTEADTKIANGEAYKTKEDAQAAADAELPNLVKAKLASSVTSQAIQAKATETKAPSGYTLDTTAHESSKVYPSNYTLSGTTATYSTVSVDIGTVTNDAAGAATAQVEATTKEYTYSIPVSISLTKTDADSGNLLSGAVFDITTKGASDTTFTRKQSKTTDSNGAITTTDTITGKFSVTSKAYKYYVDYDSLVSTVKTEADKKIASGEMYKDETAARAAMLASLPSLAEEYLKTNISAVALQAQAIETTAPAGYELDATAHTSKEVKPTTYSLSDTVFTYDTVALQIGTITNEPKGAATSTLSSVTQNYSYTIPLQITLTKKDSDSDNLLQGAVFDITTKSATDSSFTRKQSKTTDNNGAISTADTVNGTFTITSNTFKYYDDYDSLVGTVKDEADKKIASNQVYKTKADAQAAQAASLPVLAKEYVEANISAKGIQAQAIETTAPDGYTLDTTVHTSEEVKPDKYTLSGTTFTYNTVTLPIGTVINTPKGASVSTVAAIEKQYSYVIPLQVTLTKKDSSTSSLLKGATFDITTKGLNDVDFTRKQTKTTDTNGSIIVTDSINGTFKVKSKEFKYYDDYNALVSTVKENADKKIAAGEMYKTKADAEAAQAASIPVLATEYLANNISTESIQAQAIETAAPDGYTLDTTAHLSKEVTPSKYSLTDSVFTYETVNLDIGDITNTPKGATISTIEPVTTTYTYTIPMSVTLTKKDSTADIMLADANYTLSTKTLKDSDFVRSQNATTDKNGSLNVLDSVSGTFDVKTSSYKYYDDYDALVSTVKEEADKKIAANEVYKTKADAQAAQAASIPVLAKNYVENNISTEVIQAKAVETKAPSGYVLDTTEHVSKEVKPTKYTLTDTTFMYDTVNLSIGTLTNTPKSADVETLNEVTTKYTYTIPMSVTLTKKDATADILLADASYTLATKTLLDADFSRAQVSATNEDGVLTVNDSVSGEFSVTTSSYSYYTDYDSLVSTVKEDADSKIAAKEVYKTKEDAQVALNASIPVLAKLYLEKNISSQDIQASATEIKAPDGYVVDSEVHISDAVKPTNSTLTNTEFTYDKVSLNIGTLTNTPKPAVVDELDAQTKEYSYNLPVDIQLVNQDVDTEEPLIGSDFTITSATSQKDSSFAETYNETTNEVGKINLSREITNKFTVTSSSYKYYDDYDALVSTVKAEADEKIANNEIYQSKETAQAALEEEQEKLANQYMTNNISTTTLQSTAKQTKAATPYVLNTETYELNDVPMTNYAFDEDTNTFNYETVIMDYKVVNNLKYLVELVNIENEVLEGAEFQIQDVNGTVIDEWVSSEEPHAIPELVDNQTYTIVEVKAPQGYVLANSTTFETIDEHNTKITIVNGKYSVSLVDSQEETIEGAKFQLLDEEGNILEEWVSTEDVYIPDSLTVGKTYTIVETYTPTGFNQMQPYTFTVANENEAIVLKNNCTSIYKKTSTGKAVVGAALQIQDEEGNVIDSWLSGQQVVSLEDSVVKEANEKGIAYIVKPDISENSTEETIPSDEDLAIIIMQKVKPTTTENTYVLITEYSDGNWTYQEVDSKGIELGHRANLISDTNYELVETKAPDGFELASNMSFIAKADTDYSVTMIDEYKVEAAIHKLATGIHSNITYIAVGFAAIVILVVIFVLRKKKHTATN